MKTSGAAARKRNLVDYSLRFTPTSGPEHCAHCPQQCVLYDLGDPITIDVRLPIKPISPNRFFQVGNVFAHTLDDSIQKIRAATNIGLHRNNIISLSQGLETTNTCPQGRSFIVRRLSRTKGN